MGVQNATITGNTQATGSSEGNEADLVVGGTFVATIQLQVAIPGAAGADLWVPCGQLTAAGIVKVQTAVGRKFRAISTAYTSGTAYISLGVSRNNQFLQT